MPDIEGQINLYGLRLAEALKNGIGIMDDGRFDYDKAEAEGKLAGPDKEGDIYVPLSFMFQSPDQNVSRFRGLVKALSKENKLRLSGGTIFALEDHLGDPKTLIARADAQRLKLGLDDLGDDMEPDEFF